MNQAVTACVIVIGNEILSGRTQDINLNHIATTLGGWGIQVHHARVIPDDEEIIVNTINEVRVAYDYVFTTGGIGPTHDDITTECIAAAFGKKVIRHPEAEARLLAHYENTGLEFNAARQKMADIPEHAALIDNPLSAAPGFILENVHVFAGVPSIMQAMFEGLRDSLPGGVTMTRLTVQCAIGEGTIASIMATVQAAHEGVSIGSYPWFKPGQFGTAAVVSGLDQQVTHAAAKALAAGVREMGADAEVMPLG